MRYYENQVLHHWAQHMRLLGKFFLNYHNSRQFETYRFMLYLISDVTLNGYHIPTGAQIIPLQHFVHNDPKLWDEPEAFKPERFINAEGKVKKPDCFLPFGVGKFYT